MQIDQSMNKGHMNFFLCCAGAHDLGHDFCVARMKNHFKNITTRSSNNESTAVQEA